MAEVVTSVVPLNGNESAASSSTEVYAVFGAEPEVLAYAMAKYSRSALSMKDSLKEISQQKAEKFLNTFYFQYGHLPPARSSPPMPVRDCRDAKCASLFPSCWKSFVCF